MPVYKKKDYKSLQINLSKILQKNSPRSSKKILFTITAIHSSNYADHKKSTWNFFKQQIEFLCLQNLFMLTLWIHYEINSIEKKLLHHDRIYVNFFCSSLSVLYVPLFAGILNHRWEIKKSERDESANTAVFMFCIVKYLQWTWKINLCSSCAYGSSTYDVQYFWGKSGWVSDNQFFLKRTKSIFVEGRHLKTTPQTCLVHFMAKKSAQIATSHWQIHIN